MSKWRGQIAGVLAGVALLAGCGSQQASRTVPVAYAGSLGYLMDQQVGPAFDHATHLVYQGRGGGALGLAQEIRSGTVPADVFLSIGTAPIAVLGARAPWAIGFASAPLVLAYNPKSRFAPELEAVAAGKVPFRQLFRILATPGFRLGRTNPNTDPQGQAFYLMVELAQRLYGLPAATVQQVLGSPDNPAQIFSETGILSQLESGNLDASSAFLPEAREHHLPYILLPAAINFSHEQDAFFYRQASLRLSDGRVVRGAPLTVDVTVVGSSAQGERFARYLLQHPEPWIRDGYRWIPFQYWGRVHAIPPTLRDVRS